MQGAAPWAKLIQFQRAIRKGRCSAKPVWPQPEPFRGIARSSLLTFILSAKSFSFSDMVRRVEQRVSLITLGVSDLRRSRSFYEQLGWTGQEIEETVFFQAGGQAVVLWGREKVAVDAGIEDDPTSNFGGIVLAHNVHSRDDVDQVVSAAARAGGEVTKVPSETFYGGYAGFFRDPDGHVWEVAHNPGFSLGVDGTLTLPDFGSTPTKPTESSA
jgi:uncharacterized protein